MLHHLTKITEVVRWSYFYLRRSCGLKTIFCKLWFGVLFSNFFRVSCAVWRSRLPWFMFENPRNQFDWSCLPTQCCNFYVAFREISFPNFGCYLVFSFPDAQLLISWTHYCNTLKQLLANSRVLSPAVSISPNNIFEILGNSSHASSGQQLAVHHSCILKPTDLFVKIVVSPSSKQKITGLYLNWKPSFHQERHVWMDGRKGVSTPFNV